MSEQSIWGRFRAEAARAWAIAVKDVRVYYLTPPVIMYGLFMPFFMFFSFSVRRGMAPQSGVARLLALTTFFTASSAGPVIIPLERRVGTYDRLLTAPLSLITILVGKSLVGALFALAVSLVPLVAGLAVYGVTIADPLLLPISVMLSAGAFSTLGVLFASGSAQSPGQVMMPSTLLRWPLLFVSGIFIPLREMAPWVRAISYVSPLTYAQDLLNHAMLGHSEQSPLLDLVVLTCLLILFLIPALKLHDRSRRLGY
jgi:ABC-2 type transport system permease protein